MLPSARQQFTIYDDFAKLRQHIEVICVTKMKLNYELGTNQLQVIFEPLPHGDNSDKPCRTWINSRKSDHLRVTASKTSGCLELGHFNVVVDEDGEHDDVAEEHEEHDRSSFTHSQFHVTTEVSLRRRGRERRKKEARESESGSRTLQRRLAARSPVWKNLSELASAEWKFLPKEDQAFFLKHFLGF